MKKFKTKQDIQELKVCNKEKEVINIYTPNGRPLNYIKQKPLVEVGNQHTTK